MDGFTMLSEVKVHVLLADRLSIPCGALLREVNVIWVALAVKRLCALQEDLTEQIVI